jgi:hypothetical protein
MSEEVHKLDEVAGQVIDVRITLARMEGKLDTLVTGHADHETRLRRVERFLWLAVGASAVAGGAAGKLAGLL